MSLNASDQSSTKVIVGAAIGGLILGSILVAAGLLLCLRIRDGQLDLGRFGTIVGGSKPRIPSSPHYLSAKQQNHYVSVGSLDWKKSSVVEEVGGNGSISTLGRGLRPPPLKISNSNVSDYPTATIKRNSGGHNPMRTNIEADIMYRWSSFVLDVGWWCWLTLNFVFFSRGDMTLFYKIWDHFSKLIERPIRCCFWIVC